MKKYVPRQNEDISTTAQRMVEIAKNSGEEVRSTFNMIKIVAKPSDSPEDVKKEYLRLARFRR